MINSYATFTVHKDTAQKYGKPREVAQQRIEIPSSWFGSRYGSYRIITRTVTVLGTVEVEQYSKKRVEYGKCSYSGMLLTVAQDGTNWRAVDRKPVNGCITA